MLLIQYDEQAHIEYEKELSFEEGQKAERARFAKLCQLLKSQGRDADLEKATFDIKFCEILYNEFSL